MKARVLLTVWCGLVTSSWAEERPFALTRSTNLEHPGGVALNFDTQVHAGRPDGYSQVLLRPTIEWGLVRSLQAGLGLETVYVGAGRPGEEHTHIEGVLFTEWGWSGLSGRHDAVGVGVWGMAGAGPTHAMGELRLVLDKTVGNLDVALNAAALFEKPLTSGVHGAPWLRWSESLGVGYRLPTGFRATLEMLARTSVADGETPATALFVGPGFGYTGAAWFLNVTLQAQVWGRSTAHARLASNEALDFTDHARFALMMTVGGVVTVPPAGQAH